MQYQEALRVWGALRLDRWAAERAALISAGWPGTEPTRHESVDPASVNVEFTFDEGASYGSSQDYSASAEVRITGTGSDGHHHEFRIDITEFDFAALLGEIVAVAGGTVTS